MGSTTDVAPGKHVVIVGAGFAGLHCAMTLARDEDVRVTIIDRNNYQQFQPLLYQVATGSLSAESAAFNLRSIFSRHANVDVHISEIVSVDPETRSATGRNGDVYQGDYLVLAAGTEANFFDIPGVAEYALPMYSLRDAERLRSTLFALLEASDLKAADKSADVKVSIVVVGAGPTGVETAGAIVDMFNRAPKHLFSNFDLSKATVTLVNRGKTVLPPFKAASQDYVARVLSERGVIVRLGTAVKEITQSEVLFADGSHLPASLVIWAGGLKAASLAKDVGIAPGRGGRIDVNDDLTVPGHPQVYALGDFANAMDKHGNYLPQLGSVALQAGRHCARNILAATRGEPLEPFAYFDKGIMAMVGLDAAVAEIGPRHFPIDGPLAFAAWLGIHAVLLTTVRAKTETLLEWAWDYIGGTRVSPILDQQVELPKRSTE